MDGKQGANVWSVVLAGGEGERLRPFVKSWLGESVPKQYLTVVGTRSMLQHTVGRADQVASSSRRVTVVGRDHLAWVRAQLAGDPGRIVVQPSNRDTAAGIFLPLAYVRAADPGATAVIFPSDHFVHPEEQFVSTVRRMAEVAGCLERRIVLLGARPETAESEYGWIDPGAEVETGGLTVRLVRRFLEKPDPETARAALGRGAVWNTLVVAGKVETLWEMGRRSFPETMLLLDLLVEEVGRPGEGELLEAIYRELKAANFSRDLLEGAAREVVLVTLEGAEWSDWGRPERIVESLSRLGLDPAFDPRLALRAG